jgi:phage repressor protein C with HTH and peptisase S24 domain
MKLSAMIGALVVPLTLGCAASAQSQVGEKKPPPEQRLQVEQAQPVPRVQNTDSQGVGLIPNDSFRAHFGRAHKFHLSESNYGHDRHFQYGGYSFGFVDEWPTNWLPPQDVFVIRIDGAYYLCNRTYPGVQILLNVAL